VWLERLVTGELGTNCWLVGDTDGGPALVLDPAGSPERVTTSLGGRGVSAIVLTHGHFDHLGAVGELVSSSGAPLMVHALDAPCITDAAENGAAFFGFDLAAPAADTLLDEGDVVRAGALAFEVLHTPGHTPGGICLLGHGHLFSGDTLFSGSVGRTDLPGGDGRTLKRSLDEKLAQLPDETVVHPGHGPDTTIARERAVNPFFPRA
jgi:glyoxylase-like metal-dependent hydrolase (beta-lactamase superfamily II)